MNVPVRCKCSYLLHKIRASDSTGSLCLDLPRHNNARCNGRCPPTEDVSRRPGARLHRFALLIEHLLATDSPLGVMAAESFSKISSGYCTRTNLWC